MEDIRCNASQPACAIEESLLKNGSGPSKYAALVQFLGHFPLVIHAYILEEEIELRILQSCR